MVSETKLFQETLQRLPLAKGLSCETQNALAASAARRHFDESQVIYLEGEPAGTVHILEKEYRIACPEEERESLLAAAQFLNGKMREIRDTGKIVGMDRIAVMAALNITHELLQNNSGKDSYKQTIGSRIRTIQEKLEYALAEGKQMEL